MGQQVQAHIVKAIFNCGPLQFSIVNDGTLLRDIHDEQHIHKTLRTSACAKRLVRQLRILFLKSLVGSD